MVENHTIAKIRTKYASGLYSNTELVVEYAPLIGAIGILDILSYAIKPDICADKRLVILEMPAAQEVLTAFYKGLRLAYSEIEASDMDDAWRTKEYETRKYKLTVERDKALKQFSWFVPEMLGKMYHD